jgi:hypothetical protein
MSNVNFLPKPLSEPWSRLWLPAATWDQYRGVDNDFLSDAGGMDGFEHAFDGPLPGIGSLKDFGSVPFLLLLGRPGSGKSQELGDAEREGWLGKSTIRVEAKEIGISDPCLYLPALLPSSVASSTRLIIDGLDEVLLQNPNFVAQLKAWFRRHLDPQGRPIHLLAISCRWADWPQSQIEELASLWAPDDFTSLVLCPLRHGDVVGTLQRRFGDKAEVFWQQMKALHLRYVACWPQGLLGLMNQFEDSGCKKLASSHAEVIHDQIVRHCRLTDSPDDRLRWERSADGAEWRQRIAGRVAAAMIWSGKAQLDLTGTAAGTHHEALTPADFATREELWEGHRLRVKLPDLDELVHRTGLMKRLTSQNRWVFQSQVHQEWLAASWLAAQKLDATRLQQIFGVTADGTWTVFPVLKATAAWLARFDRDFRDLVLRQDPLVLLRMDGASLPEKERMEIVEALLNATRAIGVVDSGILQAHLPSLKHSGLVEQLTRWLTDEDVSDPAKELAIEIAERTDLTELAGLLWDLFPNTAGRLQIEMAGALSRLAREGFDEKWRAVFDAEIPLDQRGKILGAALDVMVISSRKIPVRDVLEWVIPERHFQEQVWDLYQFNVRTLHEHLTVEDLPAVFAKLAECPRSIHDTFSRAGDFNDAAVRLALREFHRPEVRAALVDYWHICLRHHSPPHHRINEAWSPEKIGLEDDVKRRDVILALIHHPALERQTERKWIATGDYLLLERDFDWCLDRILEAAPVDEWRFSLVVASFIWRVELSGSLGEKLKHAWNKSPALRDLLPVPVPAADETIIEAIRRAAGEQQAKRERQGKAWEEKRAKQERKFQENLKRHTLACRAAHERGEVAWPGVEEVLGARASGPGSRIVSFQPISLIGPDESWMIEAAARYLTDCTFKENREDEHGLYGLLALAACPEELEHDGPVRRSIEQRWLPLLIPQLSGRGLGDPPGGISIERFSRLFPEAFTTTFGDFCRKRYKSRSSLLELHAFKECWNPAMTEQLKSILSDEELYPEGFFNGLRFLANESEEVAIVVALRRLHGLTPDSPRPVKAAVIGAAATLVNGRLAAEISRYLSDTTLVSDFIRAAAYRLDWLDSWLDFSRWPDQALKTLADACWGAFPCLDRFRSHGSDFRSVTDEDQALEFRDRISAAARSRGIEVSIPDAYQDDSEDEARQRARAIDWHRHAATEARVGNAWAHMEATTFFELTSRPNARLARNQDELLAAVIECLWRWETALTAGAWDHLWDIKTRTSRPEKRIAREMRDWLHQHLEIMVEREIELASEDRTDVVVQTLPSDPSSPKFTVVIELKKHRASNAKERKTSMKSQLMDCYLRERAHEGWTHGLYAIAWTPAPGSKDDTSEAINDTRLALEQQAKKLCVSPFKVESMVIDARFQSKARSL